MRCETTLIERSILARSNARTAAIALAALIVLPFALGMPILSIEQFGHAQQASVLGGVRVLFAGGHFVIGFVVLLCSVILPIAKLLGLFVLASGGVGLARHHRAWTYRFVEWTGKWGMLDVLLVAVLVAAIKMGDLVEVTPGPAALAFCIMVLLSLSAAACFDPHALWGTNDKWEPAA